MEASLTPRQAHLVNTIIDGELETAKISKDATSMGKLLADRLTTLTRNIVKLRANGKISTGNAKSIYLKLYNMLSLIGFVRVAQDVKDHGSKISTAIVTAAKELGDEVKSIPAIRDADVLKRKLESQGALSKDGTLET